MEFSGCYLLRSQNPRFKTSCYVGFTVDPKHRIKQHNGEIVGGAFKTHTKRPWEMTMVVYGFPTRKLALRFEWTWQHPTESKWLKHVNWNEIFQKYGGPRKYNTHVRILKEMLNTTPWVNLSLRICVTCNDVLKMLLDESPVLNQNHTATFGKLEEIPIGISISPDQEPDNMPKKCVLCVNSNEYSHEPINWVICPFCGAFLHLRCLAFHFTNNSNNSGSSLIPTRGSCPSCCETLSWRDLVEIRNKIEPDFDKSILQLSIAHK